MVRSIVGVGRWSTTRQTSDELAASLDNELLHRNVLIPAIAITNCTDSEQTLGSSNDGTPGNSRAREEGCASAVHFRVALEVPPNTPMQ